jgi:TP901-1 family phage major tail protein
MPDPIRGIDILVKVNTGSEASPVWTTVGGQRGLTLNRSADTLDNTSKTDDLTLAGWKSQLSGLREWSIDCDGLLVDGDAALDLLETAWEGGDYVQVQAVRTGKTYQGNAYITDLSIDAPHDDMATVSCTLVGAGALAEV